MNKKYFLFIILLFVLWMTFNLFRSDNQVPF